ncbi:MAG: GNAT family N-acetyltransferase [Beijerinckiaceae bacterium]
MRPELSHLALRPPRDDERQALVELWIAAWKATYPDIDFDARRDWFVRHLAELEAAGAKTICAFDGARLMGFVVIDPATGWLDQIAVRPKSFGAGIAGKLLGAARRVSPERITLDVNADNFRALRFYKREGFQRIGAGTNKLSGRETAKLEWRRGG